LASGLRGDGRQGTLAQQGNAVEVHLLAIQARLLLWVGLGVLIAGLWLGVTPWTCAWRAAVAALVAMWVGRWLLSKVMLVIEERMAADMAERQLAEEAAARAAEEQEAKERAAALRAAAKPAAPTPPGRPLAR
jgi:hypothetical protein